MEKIKKLILENNIIKFIIVGGCSTGIDFIIYMLLSTFLSATFSKAVSMIVASVFSYFVNKSFTFRNKDKTNIVYLIKFYLVFAANLIVNISTNYLVLNVTKNKIVAFAVATVCGMLVNYLGQRFFVFAKGDRFMRKKIFIFAGVVVLWIILLLTRADRLFFVYDKKELPFLYYPVKLFFLCALLGVAYWLSYIFEGLRAGNKQIKRGLKIAGIFGIISFVGLLLLWPGTWAWDDIGVLSSVQGYWWQSLQHFLTSIQQAVFLQLLPFPAGIIILQLIFASVVVAYSITVYENIFLKKKDNFSILFTIVEILPFILPPVFLYNYSGFRMSIYTYCEILFFSIIIDSLYNEFLWNWKKILCFSILCSVIATWRSEGIIYLLVGLVFFLVCKTEKIKIVLKVAGIVCTLLFFFAITKVQNYALGEGRYAVMSTANTVVEVLRAADRDDPIEKELVDDISEVINLDEVYGSDASGLSLIWGDLVREDYTSKEYRTYTRAVLKLSLRHIPVVVKERMNEVVKATTIHGKTSENMVDAAATLYEPTGSIWADYFREQDWILNKPINEKVRKNTILLLGCENSNYEINPLYRLFWAPEIPFLILLVSMFIWLIQKKKALFFLSLSMLGKVAIILIAQPEAHFMYFIPTYVSGYICLIWFLLYIKVNGLREKKNAIEK